MTQKSTGRPAHKPTARKRKIVRVNASLGMPKKDIFTVLDISEPTFDKYYRADYEHGLALVTSELNMKLYDAAMKGNVSAIKPLLERLPPLAEGDLAPKGDGTRPKVVRLGKKEQAERDAQTAGQGTEWGDDLSPPAVDVG